MPPNQEINPLLEIQFRIPFDRIRAEHVGPAIQELLSDAREKLDKELQRRQERTKLFRQMGYAAEFLLVYARNERFEEVGTLWPALPSAKLTFMPAG